MPDSAAVTLCLHPETAGSACAYYGTLRMGLAGLATPSSVAWARSAVSRWGSS